MADSNKDSGFVKNIFVGYFVLLLHVALLVLLGLFIVFFRGMIEYLPWIVGGGCLLVLSAAYWVYRRVKRGQAGLKETLSSAVPQNRSVEVSVLGGLAAIRVGAGGGEYVAPQAPLQLEDPETSRVRSMERLADMLEKGLLSKEEFDQLKQELMQGFAVPPSAKDDGGDVIDVEYRSNG